MTGSEVHLALLTMKGVHSSDCGLGNGNSLMQPTAGMPKNKAHPRTHSRGLTPRRPPECIEVTEEDDFDGGGSENFKGAVQGVCSQ